MAIRDWWTKFKYAALKQGSQIAVKRVAENALDDLETALFGDVGEAEKSLRREEGVDPLSRVRNAHGIQPDTTSDRKDTDTLANAQAELARLKEQQKK